MTTEKQAVKVIAEEIMKAIRTITNDNNRNYVNNQIKNYSGGSGGSGSGGGGGGGGIIPGTINASQVNGLSGAIGAYMANIQTASAGGDELAGSIISVINTLADIRVQNATIDTAHIRDLYASYGEFLNLVAQNAQIEDLDVGEIRADIANISMANIGSADIGFGQIKDLTTHTAIIRQGQVGELYIDRLAVTDANMVSLTVGDLMLRNEDGEFVKIIVDGEGNVGSEAVTFSGDDILDNNSLSGSKIISLSGGKIIENSITTRELNVSSIFADSAVIGAIKAGTLNAAEITALDGFIGNLATNIIRSTPQDRAALSGSLDGSAIDISTNSSITLTNGRIGLVVSSESTESNLVLTDRMLNAISGRINFEASRIDLSANESITAKVRNEITDELSGRITKCETDIIEQNQEILLRATKQELEEVDGRVFETSLRMAELELDAESIKLAVASKSSNYRQNDPPVAQNAGDIWIRPSTGAQYQAVGAIGRNAPIFTCNDDGELLYSFYDDADQSFVSTVNVIVDEDGNLQIESVGSHSIDDDGYLVNTGVWEDIISAAFANLVVSTSGIDATVSGLSGNITTVSQKADRIDWIVANGSTASQLSLTSNALAAIADNIDLTGNDTVRITSANQISVSAVNNLDLNGNSSVRITSANQISASAAENLDLTGNSSVRITSANQISANAADAIDLSSNGTIKLAIQKIGVEITRNILLSSEQERVYAGSSSKDSNIFDFSFSDYGNSGIEDQLLESGEATITIAYDGKSTVAGNEVYFGTGVLIYSRGSSGNDGIIPSSDFVIDSLTTSYERYTHTITINSLDEFDILYGNLYFKIRQSLTPGAVTIKNIKVVLGDTMTKWSQAPEDDVNLIISAQNKADSAYALAESYYEEYERAVRIDEDGLHVGDNQSTGEVLIDSNSVNIVVNNEKVSQFAGNFIRLGNMLIRQPKVGGLTIQVVNAT